MHHLYNYKMGERVASSGEIQRSSTRFVFVWLVHIIFVLVLVLVLHSYIIIIIII